MLEATIVLQLAIGQHLTAVLIAALLVLNVTLGTIQESRAEAALALLKERLSLRSRTRRDGGWIDVPRVQIVRRLRMTPTGKNGNDGERGCGFTSTRHWKSSISCRMLTIDC
jgi:hypothetical protein